MPPITNTLASAIHLAARYQLDRSDAQEKAPNNVLGIYWAMFAAFIIATAIAGSATFAVTTVTVQKLQTCKFFSLGGEGVMSLGGNMY